VNAAAITRRARYYASVRKHAKLGKRTISYLDVDGPRDPAGHAPRTLVWLHAFPLNSEMWAPQLDAVPRGWRIIAPDLPGFGGTDPLHDGTPLTLDEFAADVIDLLQALHVDHAALGGLSMGGYVAFALLRLTPQGFGGLILADTRAGGDSEAGREGRRGTIALAEQGGAAAVADDMIPKLLGETTRRERPDIVSRVRGLMAASPVGAIAAASRAMMARSDSTALLASIRCPTLVLVGEEDTVTPPAESEKLHAGIAGSTFTRIARAGHLSNLEQPAAFTAAVAGFLAHRV
jgi:3-oxoadipate enol-lactonase